MDNLKKEVQEVVERIKKYVNEFDKEAFKENCITTFNNIKDYINSKLNKG